LGEALVRALVSNGIFIDLTHLRDVAITGVLSILRELDPEKKIPVIASHAACRFDDKGREYNLTAEQIKQIVERRGTIGLIVCRDFMRDHVAEKDTVDVIAKHVRRIADITQASGVNDLDPFDCVSIGTDLDGFVQPLHGLETAAGLQLIAEGMRRKFGDAVAKKICFENATRVLHSGRNNPPTSTGRIPWAPIV
jgi:microsomal dipeptidase-like Zn-dependent dipeptidase